MKAAVLSKYGLPGDLSIKETDIPTPQDNEVLIRVHDTNVNRSDYHILSLSSSCFGLNVLESPNIAKPPPLTGMQK